MIRYGLKLKSDNTLLGFSTSENDGDFCVGVSFRLDTHPTDGRIWLVETFEKAEHVRKNSTEWYNADYEKPQNEYKANLLEVVKIEINY